MRLSAEAWSWVLLGTLAILTMLANHALQRPLSPSPSRLQGADHSFVHPRTLLFDAQGRLVYEIQGDRLEHRAESGAYLMHPAQVWVFPKPDENGFWYLEAERAHLAANRHKAWLEGAVTVRREGVPPADALQIITRDVSLDLVGHTASSQSSMLALGSHWQSQADTFFVDFTQRLLKQEGHVHDRFDPPKR